MKYLSLIIALVIGQTSFAKDDQALELINTTGTIQHFTAPCRLAPSDTHVELEIVRLTEAGFDLVSKISMSNAFNDEVKYDASSCFYLYVKKSARRD